MLNKLKVGAIHHTLCQWKHSTSNIKSAVVWETEFSNEVWDSVWAFPISALISAGTC
jgi:hypothetical protein